MNINWDLVKAGDIFILNEAPFYNLPNITIARFVAPFSKVEIWCNIIPLGEMTPYLVYKSYLSHLTPENWVSYYNKLLEL